MIRYIVLALTLATPAAAIQCDDGSWRDLAEHCDNRPTVQCPGGSWRDDAEDCPASEQRPEPRPEPRPTR